MPTIAALVLNARGAYVPFCRQLRQRPSRPRSPFHPPRSSLKMQRWVSNGQQVGSETALATTLSTRKISVSTVGTVVESLAFRICQSAPLGGSTAKTPWVWLWNPARSKGRKMGNATLASAIPCSVATMLATAVWTRVQEIRAPTRRSMEDGTIARTLVRCR